MSPQMAGPPFTQLQSRRNGKCFSLSNALHFQKPLYFQDERFSSAAVERVMIADYDMSRKKRKEKLDAGAAAYILQGLLDRIRYPASLA